MNKTMRKMLSTTALISALFFSAGAEAMIVYDPSNYSEAVTQFNQMVKSYQQQLQQLQQQIQQTSALTGTRSMGSLLNGPAEADLRRFLPPDWQDTMKMGGATGLGSSASQTQGLYNSYYTAYAPVTGAAAVSKDPAGPVAQSIDRNTQTTYAAMAASESSYNEVTPRTTTYENLLQQVNTTTDLKSSIDLQSRINAENGMAINELVRLNSIQVQQKAAEDNQQLTALKQNTAANHYDPVLAQSAFHP